MSKRLQLVSLVLLLGLAAFFGWQRLVARTPADPSALAAYEPQKPVTDKSKRPSPPAPPTVCTFSDSKTITVEYSTPAMKGRKIFGGLVPFNEIWRTGANEATTFVPTTDIVIGGTRVPAGSYTLYTLPGEKAWKLVLSKKTGQWGIPYPEGQDLGRFDMKTELIEIPIEKLHISFMEKPGAKDVCTLRVDWEKTRAYVDIAEKK